MLLNGMLTRFAYALLWGQMLVASAAADPMKKVAAELEKIAGELDPKAMIVKDTGGGLILKFKARKFMVHGRSMIGRISEKAHETEGPSFDGMIVTVRSNGGRYGGQAVIPQHIRQPYWTTFVNAYHFDQGRRHLQVNIAYGSRTDPKLMERLNTFFAGLVDDPESVTRK